MFSLFFIELRKRTQRACDHKHLLLFFFVESIRAHKNRRLCDKTGRFQHFPPRFLLSLIVPSSIFIKFKLCADRMVIENKLQEQLIYVSYLCDLTEIKFLLLFFFSIKSEHACASLILLLIIIIIIKTNKRAIYYKVLKRL